MTEQAIKGQIGQPAACMMENKDDPLHDESCCAIMAEARRPIDGSRVYLEDHNFCG